MDMDKIKLDFTYSSDADPENRYLSSITILINENKNVMGKLIAKEELERLPQGEIGFVDTFSMEPEYLLTKLLGRKYLLLVLREVGMGKIGMRLLSCIETQNSIIWCISDKPRPQYFPLNIGFWCNKDSLGKELPEIRFEFDKKQYYQELRDFVDKILDNVNCDVMNHLPYLNTIEAKKINNKRLNDFIIVEEQILFDEQCLFLEDHLLPKREKRWGRYFLENVIP